MTLNWRSILFVPGTRPERFDKAFASGADAVCVDLEDAVEAAGKQQAREQMYAALQKPRQVSSTVRINGTGTRWHEEDVQAAGKLPDAVFLALPKAHLDGVQALSRETPKHQIIALLEDAQGIEEAYQIARQNSVVGLMLGAADLVAQLGAPMEWDALLYARSRMLMAAVNADCLAIDVPCLELKNPEVVFAQTQRVKTLGYACKAVIHPAQIEPVHRALMPSESDISQARAMLDTFDRAGGRAVEWNGVMLDEAVLVSARRVLALVGETILAPSEISQEE